MTEMSLELGASLAAWRLDSRRLATPDAAERVRAAMLDALAHPAPAAGLARLPSKRWRLRRVGLVPAGALAVFGALGVVAAAGWNAPAGSPLAGIRTARESVELALPGSNATQLHLRYAEADLGDARDGEQVSASLVDAASQLAQARGLLLAEPSNPLWSEWNRDEQQLRALQLQAGAGVTPPGAPQPGVAATPTPTQHDASGGETPNEALPSTKPAVAPTEDDGAPQPTWQASPAPGGSPDEQTSGGG